MDLVEKNSIAHFRQLADKIAALRQRFFAPRLPDTESSQNAAIHNTSDFLLNKKAQRRKMLGEMEAGFAEIWHDVFALPEDDRVLLCHLYDGCGESTLRRWSEGSGPHPLVIPASLDILDEVLDPLINATAEEQVFHSFLSIAVQFFRSAWKAEAEYRNIDHDSGDQPPRACFAQTLALRDRLQIAFAQLGQTHMDIMDMRLRSYRPPIFAEDLAPVHLHGDPQAMEHIKSTNKAFNEQSTAEAKPYQTGKITIHDLINLIDNEHFPTLAGFAAMILHGCDIYNDPGDSLSDIELEANSPSPAGPPANPRLP